MSAGFIGMKTRQVFRECLVEWTLREISDEFDAAGVGWHLEYQPNVSGQRCTLVEQYYHSVDWNDWREIKKVIQVFEGVLAKACELEKWHKLGAATQGTSLLDAKTLAIKRMINALERDGFHVVDGKIITGSGLPALDYIKETAAVFDSKHMHDQIRRMEASVDTDPSLAIGTAKELIETCCKTILAARGKAVSGTPDVSTLTKETLKELKLVPEGVPDAARGADVIKRLLSNLGTIGNGLAELRGLYGTGHGKHGSASGLGTRHAKLAVGAAATLTVFLFETHKETTNNLTL